MGFWTDDQERVVVEAASQWVRKYRRGTLEDKEDAAGDAMEILLRRRTSLPLDEKGIAKFVCTACSRSMAALYVKRFGRNPKRGALLFTSQLGRDADEQFEMFAMVGQKRQASEAIDLRHDLIRGAKRCASGLDEKVLLDLMDHGDRRLTAKRLKISVSTVHSCVHRVKKEWRREDSFMRANGYGDQKGEEKNG